MSLQEKMQQMRRERKALLATNYYNFETLKGVITSAQELRRPLILQITESSIRYMGLENAIALGRSALKSSGVEGWIHLDHGGSLELVEACLKAGVDSVMFDGSELPFEQNVELTRKAVSLAASFGANVEAELGYVAKLGQSTDKIEYTSPEDAKLFVEQTAVNALAVAVGTAHGFYKSEPKLDLNRIARIKDATPAALVLHGGSGVPPDQLQKSVQAGITKVNLATEIKNIFMKTLKTQLNATQDIDLRHVFPPAISAVTEIVKRYQSLLG